MHRKSLFIVPVIAVMILFCRLPMSAASDTDGLTPQQKGINNTVELLRNMDTDQNGKVSRAEYDNYMNREFDMLDVDRNGELDANELSKFHLDNYLAAQLLPLMDKDNNGKVSRAEFMNFMNQEFDQLDVNKDGQLDVTELAETHLRYAHATAR
jgi:Ca2+-binding EF-hand superfamily protein